MVKQLPFSSAAAHADVEQGLEGICVELLEVRTFPAESPANIMLCQTNACLLQTMGGLHYKANLAHMNIHPGPITVLDHAEACKHINLKDFGFARELPPGTQDHLLIAANGVGMKVFVVVLNPTNAQQGPMVCSSAGSASTGWIDYNACTFKPAGVCSAFAAPEHVYAVWLLCQGKQDDNATLISGPAADMWSLGVVMYVWVSSDMVTCFARWISFFHYSLLMHACDAAHRPVPLLAMPSSFRI